MTAGGKSLPYGVGRLSAGWIVLMAILLAIVGVGAFAYSRQLAEGLVVTGLRDVGGTMGGAPLGLYIVFDIYFVGISFAGITVAALIRLFDLKHLKPIARMAEVLTVISLVLSAFTIIPDLGQPLRGIVNLVLYGRPQSPLFGSFTLVVAGYLFASLIYLYLDGRRDAALCAQEPGRLQGFYRLWAAGYTDTPQQRERRRKASRWLAIAILPLLVTAHSTLGMIFGVQGARPGWFSALQAPAFVVLAGVSGVGMLIVIAAILRKVLGVKDQITPDVFRWLGGLLLALTIAYLYFVIVELLTSSYAAHDAEVKVSAAVVAGEYAWLYWLSVGLLVVPVILLFVQFTRKRFNLTLTVLSGILVNVAAIGKRFLIVVPSQTHGSLVPYGVGSYAPTWIEYSIILGLFALGTFLYILFMKVFPIMEIPKTAEGGGG
jgi:molybdopterin-containing oxidoreductase family membrane subunit